MSDFLKYRVKVMENFKDGNIMEGKFLRANDILIISESDFVKVTNSGGVLEILDTLVPNPKKMAPEVVEAIELQEAIEELEAKVKEAEEAQAKEKTYREAAEEQKPAKRKPGRPRKADK